MAKNVPASVVAAMAANVFEPLILVEFEFDNDPLYLWNGAGPLVHGGKEYQGAGDLLAISQAEETNAVVARGMKITLSAIPADIVAVALSKPFQYRNCVVRWGAVGVDDTAVLFEGYLDTMDITDGAAAATISVTVENELAKLDKQARLRYSDQNHKQRHPNDDFFSHVTNVDRTVQWGGDSGNNSQQPEQIIGRLWNA